ncbi:MAG TPA: archaemetzincin family Zn-dependent metalloprotease [Candidatus Polarisedimenticolaceae bacterium]|nr:archaemetzincin family Zn-dependent metalloprotease [Candidatus Polarisedimenticolaceae bacterium]
MDPLEVVPFFFFHPRGVLEGLCATLRDRFRTEVRVRTPWFDPEVAFDAGRGQYRASALLRCLLDDPSGATGRVLGVTGVDLFNPVLTYVFGEAQLSNRGAVVSSRRLRPEMYGLPEDASLLQARLETEAVHELGHTFGLLHCALPTCVMHASTYVEEIDLKESRFCGSCLQRMRTVPALAQRC